MSRQKGPKKKTMVFSINAFVRLSSSSPPPLPNPSPPPFSHWSKSKEAAWRRSTAAAAMAVATAVIVAAPPMMGPTVLAAESGHTAVGPAGERWSEKRKCPPWHANSLENIVPENLPRPPPNRRSDGLAAYRVDAPALAGGSQLQRLHSSGCYDL